MERKEILVADKITKIYGIGTKTLFEALHEVSLTMYEGEIRMYYGSFWSGKINFYLIIFQLLNISYKRKSLY